MKTTIFVNPISSVKTLEIDKMPGHWLLARLGKRVLRPGGMELTRKMLETIDIQTTDNVVEFAPGLGTTARLALACNPASYTAIERDPVAADSVCKYLIGPNQRCLVGRAEATGLPDSSATVVYCEAMLTMQPQQKKVKIVQEACRILEPGGRYGLHELCLLPDDLHENIKEEIRTALSDVIHVGARPLTPSEWRQLLEENGFEVVEEVKAPMHLLRLNRVIRDEGVLGFSRFVFNVVRHSIARKRILNMRKVFKQYERYLAAILLVAVKTKV
ncbi:MAG: methyltransferase domain-containing protein [Calditrichaeota bacterium]|nr:methyltransferase domain-containing protein [Calditrichota bacterium]